MSSYSYQPKVFRNTNGCCICKAKSSSSRFTSSQKYESDFPNCFNLREKRSGKICNACVLIFKRWRKLPVDSYRTWEHVVDSKDKQGRKSSKNLKIKRNEKPDSPDITKSSIIRKHRYVRKSFRQDYLSDDQGLGDEFSGSSASSISGEDRMSEGFISSMPGSLAPSPHPQHYANDDDIRIHNLGVDGVIRVDRDIKNLRLALPSYLGIIKRKQSEPFKKEMEGLSEPFSKLDMKPSDFIDFDYWETFSTCCGVAFLSKCDNSVMLDEKYFNPSYAKLNPKLDSRKDSTSYCNRSNLLDEGVESFDEGDMPVFSSAPAPNSSDDHLGCSMLLHLSRAIVV